MDTSTTQHQYAITKSADTPEPRSIPFGKDNTYLTDNPDDVLDVLGKFGTTMATVTVSTPEGVLQGSPMGVAASLREKRGQQFSVRCHSVAEPWDQSTPVTLGWYEGPTAHTNAVEAMRQLALDMRESLELRLEEPYSCHEYTSFDGVDVVCDRTGQPKVRYEVVDERNLEEHAARSLARRWSGR